MTRNEAEQLLQVAITAQRAGNLDEARQLLRRVTTAYPDHPGALNSLGMIALAQARYPDAEQSFLRATLADPTAPDLHLNVAMARRHQHDDSGERASLEAALAIDQRHFMAFLRLAELHERRGEHVLATQRWSGVVQLTQMASPRMPELDAIAARGSAYLADRQRVLADALEEGLAAARAGTSLSDRRRFDACMDHVLGRRRIYANECEGLHYPFLPADEFFDRAHFPWMAEIEAQTDVIRAEAEALIAAGDAAIEPYVAMDPGTPENKWTPLDRSLAWGALHLWRHGVRDEEACARAPRTAEIVSRLPLADLPGRTPTVFFSLLKPRTHLPAHAGVSNTRATVHLPLIVPDGCRFRVGGETRPWRVGEAWAFDDTIEHEAWNDSDQLRAILIFDVWNPHLTDREQDLLRAFFKTVSRDDPAIRISD